MGIGGIVSNDGKVWGFKDQIEVGSRGEELFLEHYHSPIVVYPKHAADFQLVSTGQLLELKTDTYNMEKTPNFFIERWSDIAKKKPGSIWQSHGKGVEIFCYMFVRHNTYFEFRDLPALIKRLDEVTKDMYMHSIKNRGWITGGYRVPREALKDLYTQYTFEVEG